MTDFALIHDKKVAVCFIQDAGLGSDKVEVFHGFAKWRGGHLFIHRGLNIPEFPIPDDMLDRVKLVIPEVRELLEESDYCILLPIGLLPKDGKDFDNVAS